MLTKVRSFRETIANVQSEIRKKESELSREKYSRVHRSDENDLTQEEMLRQQVMRGSNVLEKTSQSIARSTQIAHETEEVGENIMGDLTTQRETLERARTTLSEADADLTRSG